MVVTAASRGWRTLRRSQRRADFGEALIAEHAACAGWLGVAALALCSVGGLGVGGHDGYSFGRVGDTPSLDDLKAASDTPACEVGPAGEFDDGGLELCLGQGGPVTRAGYL